MVTTRRPAEPLTDEQRRLVASLSAAQLRALARSGGRRHDSEREFLGLPLFSLAVGPDPRTGERRGHARGVIAIGDIATGIVAIGGWARGIVAIGGLATGVVSFGGLSIGLLAALGGLAVSVGLAIGGAALGSVAVGGASAGHYALGGAPYGHHVAGPQRIDREWVDLFERYGLAPPGPRFRPRAPAQ